MMLIEVCGRPCPFCESRTLLKLTEDQFVRYVAWKKGEGTILKLLPDLSDGEREILKTGICPACWEDTFPEEEDC